MALPKLSAQQRIVNPDGTPSSPFLQFMEKARTDQEAIDAAQSEIIADLAQAQADITATQAAQADIIADLQVQVDRLTAILAGTGEAFTGLNVGGTNMKPLLDRSDGSRFDDVTAVPGNINTTSGTRADMTLATEGDGVIPYSTANISVSAHTFQLGGQTVSLDAGFVTGLLLGQEYYVYYDDPTYSGGSVTYVATLGLGEATEAVGRFVVGRVTTPLSDGTGGVVSPAIPSWGRG